MKFLAYGKIVDAKLKNRVEMAFGFTAMGRVFAPKSSLRICDRLEKAIEQIKTTPYEQVHRAFCQWFVGNIKTREGGQPSFGQAAKVCDVTMKVLVSYCHLPDEETAERVLPSLHAAIDTKILERLRSNCSVARGVSSLSGIDEKLYGVLQELLNQEARERQMRPVEYDDVLWRLANRGE